MPRKQRGAPARIPKAEPAPPLPIDLGIERRASLQIVAATQTDDDDDLPFTEADRHWGFRFGCDGVVNLKQAAAILGNCNVETVENRVHAGLIRAGKDVGRIVICRRSLMKYIHGTEK